MARSGRNFSEGRLPLLTRTNHELDSAYYGMRSERIIHGKGTGVLRSGQGAAGEAPPGEVVRSRGARKGGKGATVVELT